MGRSPCCPEEGLNRGAWTAHEDKVLKDYITLHGEGRWRNLPKKAGLKRCGKSCRLRWLNYLRPNIKRGNISSDEEELIIRLHKLLGNRWSLIAGRLPGRTDNEIKNYWNTHLGKKVKDRHTNNQTSSSSSKRFAPPQNGNTIPKNPNPPTPNSDNNPQVFRTKATKCSKVSLINPPRPPSPMQFRTHPDAVAEAKVDIDSDVAVVFKANDPLSIYLKESDEFENGFLSLLADDDMKELSTDDLLKDYDVVGDFSLSEFLNSDFCGGFSYSNNNNSNDNEVLLLPCPDQEPVVFSDEIFTDWTQSSFAE